MREKTKFSALLATGLLSVFSCGSGDNIASIEDNTKILIPKEEISYVPVSGNSFITVKPEKSGEVINNTRLENWTNPNTVISTYFRVSKSGKLNIGLKASGHDGETSIIKVTVNGSEKRVNLNGSELKEYDAGEFQISTPGYVKVDIQGVEKTGKYFADVTDITFSGEAATGENIFANTPDYYKDLKKGPSTDIYFDLPQEETNYFYNEVILREDNPSIDFSVFNFSESILRISSGGGKEKRIMFSIDNHFSNDPKKIPEDRKTILVRQGDGLHATEFTSGKFVVNRGTLTYNWETGKTYKFLVEVKPDGGGNVDYTAWFLPPNEDSWKLIMSCKKQKVEMSHKRKMYSFLENMYPEHGHLNRIVEYKNPWIMTKSGKWIPLTKATFESYKSDIIYKQRTDAFVETTKEGFLLKNGGFFNDIVKPGTKFSVTASTNQPDIDFTKLP